MGTPAHHAGPHTTGGISGRYHHLSRRGRVIVWAVVALAALAILGAIVGTGKHAASSSPAAASTPATPQRVALQVPGDITVTTHRYTLQGTTAPRANVTVDGIAATVSAAGAWSQPVTLKHGENTFTIRSSKSGAAEATKWATVTTTWAPPAPMKLDTPPDQTVSGETLTLAGTASRSGTVTVEGKPVVSQAGHWSTVVSLHHGDNTFEVRVAQHGHPSASGTVVITRDFTPQELAAQQAAKAQAYKDSAATIPYNQLMKDADSYHGKVVTYHGQIFQIQEDKAAGVAIMLVSVTDDGYGFWTDNIWVNYKPGQVHGAKDDMVTFWGKVEGSKSYDTQIGGTTFVPEVTAKYIDG